MPKNHLVPTPITNVNGVVTTVYRRPSTPTSLTRSLPPVAPALADDESSPVEDVLALFDAPDEALERSLRNATPEQLRDVEEAMSVAREREGRNLSTKHNTEAVKSLVVDGAYSAVSKIADFQGAVPNTANLKTLGVRAVALDVMSAVQQVFPYVNVGGGMEAYATTPTKHLDALLRGIKVVAEKGDTADMVAYTQMHKAGQFKYLDTFDKYASVFPERLGVELFRTLMVDLDTLTTLTGDEFVQIPSHLKAFNETAFGSQGKLVYDGRIRSYPHMTRLVKAVEKYPDNVDEVLQWYRDGRGDGFDTEEFRAYLAGGTLKEGLL